MDLIICVLTQDFGSLVGPIGQRPVGGAVFPSQCDMQLSVERLVGLPCDQSASLKHIISLLKLKEQTVGRL